MATDLEIHGELHQWLGENDVFRDELAVWMKEVDEALDGIPDLESLLQKHRERLLIQLDKLTNENISFKAHQHALTEQQQGELTGDGSSVVKEHGRQSDQHAEQVQLCRRLKARHMSIIACWLRLFKLLRAKA